MPACQLKWRTVYSGFSANISFFWELDGGDKLSTEIIIIGMYI